MSESPQGRSVRESLELRWDEGREGALAKKLGKTYQRRRVARRVAVASTVVILVATAVVVGRRGPREDEQLLADGSTIERLGGASSVAVVEETPGEVRVRLQGGRARFKVTKNPARVFRVVSGDVSVVVLGTVFEVAREGTQTRVAVSEGQVRVTRGEQTMLLGPGDERALESMSPLQPPAEHVPAEQSPADAPPQRTPPAKAKSAGQTLTFDETLREVDRLRLAKDARAAAELLQRALRRAPQAPEAPQATFVLGRLQQEELHDPAAASRTFAKVRQLAPSSTLAEDALAREVECLVSSGDAAGARDRAALYERTYPRGAHRERLNRLAPH